MCGSAYKGKENVETPEMAVVVRAIMREISDLIGYGRRLTTIWFILGVVILIWVNSMILCCVVCGCVHMSACVFV